MQESQDINKLHRSSNEETEVYILTILLTQKDEMLCSSIYHVSSQPPILCPSEYCLFLAL